jgi:hypothetical protein
MSDKWEMVDVDTPDKPGHFIQGGVGIGCRDCDNDPEFWLLCFGTTA